MKHKIQAVSLVGYAGMYDLLHNRWGLWHHHSYAHSLAEIDRIIAHANKPIYYGEDHASTSNPNTM